MRSHGLTMSGSDSRFFSFPVKPVNKSIPDPNHNVLFFPAHHHRPIIFTTTTTRDSIGTVRVKATVNDGFVFSEAAELSFYELLGIPEWGSLVDIKQAYKQLARKYHPDVSPPGRVEEYTQRFIRVQEAYETLSDPRRRALYDRDMAKGIHLAFSARKRYQKDEGMEEKSEWKYRWQSQLSELKRRSTNKDMTGNMSWGARMRRRREESYNGL
ncbi:chaperone protein dnaJ 20, chloroplastic [Ziziphus jujuba]|uniref:Chaperone protein dnaJ 20, chloroplastic n=1 Tax=Ziziphus jujuba TaxID=326968 RepID=A0A6P3ZYK7_ZIZJJ|nr:chaperone protein dnaJ 20, chloroplastic [Ziziphus jujuba]